MPRTRLFAATRSMAPWNSGWRCGCPCRYWSIPTPWLRVPPLCSCPPLAPAVVWPRREAKASDGVVATGQLCSGACLQCRRRSMTTLGARCLVRRWQQKYVVCTRASAPAQYRHLVRGNQVPGFQSWAQLCNVNAKHPSVTPRGVTVVQDASTARSTGGVSVTIPTGGGFNGNTKQQLPSASVLVDTLGRVARCCPQLNPIQVRGRLTVAALRCPLSVD